MNVIATLNKFGIKYLDKGDDWVTVKTPFTNDSDDLYNAHGGINKKSGVFHCFKGSAEDLPFDGYLIAATGKTLPTIRKELSTYFKESPVKTMTEARIETFMQLLLTDNEASNPYREALWRKGISPEQIVEYRIGVNESGRITIPVYSPDGILVALRLYDILGHGKSKYSNYKHSESMAIFAPWNINEEVVYIAGGELKAINLITRGFPAISPTFGEKRWPRNLLDALTGVKKIYIVYDVDETGRKTAMKLCAQLSQTHDEVYDIFLKDVADVAGGDITNYFVDRQFTAEQFQKLCLDTPKYVPPNTPTVDFDDDDPIDVPSLSKSIEAKYHNKLVTTNAIISAKDTQPYVVPKRAKVRCPRTGQDICMVCPFQLGQKTDLEFDIRETDPRLLDMIECSEDKQASVLKKVARIPSNCKLCQFDSVESFNIEVIRAIPQIAVGHSSEDSSPKNIYYVGHGAETNVSYNITGRNTNEPRSQKSTILATKLERALSDIDNFVLEHDLSLFTPSEWTQEAVEVKLSDLYEDFANNVTGIRNRKDMHLFIDLVYHSALYINFQNKSVKGWVDALLLGDSGQGKSECFSTLMKHYSVGEKIDTKRATAAGLVGGAQQTGSRWFITWGTIPLNDRRLVGLEEVKGCSEEVLTKLTDMRSSGVADLQMIERARTNARTRLLWISNPRSSRNVSDYNYAVDAIQELMGSKEDVRRFDMAMIVATGEVDIDTLNGAGYDASLPHHYTSELCNHLILWAWSRRPEDIIIEKDAELAILEAAKEMSGVYSSACPLVEPADQRHKLLRLSVALAARTFSTTDGNTLIVRSCHVQVVKNFLMRVYDSDTMGYREFSKSRFTEAKLGDVSEIITDINKLPNCKALIEALLVAEYVDWRDIADYTEYDREKSSAFIGTLVRNGAIRKVRRGGYRKTPAFIETLKQGLLDGVFNSTAVVLESEL